MWSQPKVAGRPDQTSTCPPLLSKIARRNENKVALQRSWHNRCSRRLGGRSALTVASAILPGPRQPTEYSFASNVRVSTGSWACTCPSSGTVAMFFRFALLSSSSVIPDSCRSVLMDKWDPKWLYLMTIGGNGRARQYFTQHGMFSPTCAGVWDSPLVCVYLCPKRCVAQAGGICARTTPRSRRSTTRPRPMPTSNSLW